jgi:ribonuclease-3
LLCDAFEALVGALYLDGGFDRVSAFIEPRFEQAIVRKLDDESLIDARSRLQMWAQAEMGDTPYYQTLETSGPDHEREFLVQVTIKGKDFGQGRGRSKQEAAQSAAADALQRIGSWSLEEGGM